jgi:hypothetical protein
MPHRRFPPPWSVEDIGVAFKVCEQRRPNSNSTPRSTTPIMMNERCVAT